MTLSPAISLYARAYQSGATICLCHGYGKIILECLSLKGELADVIQGLGELVKYNENPWPSHRRDIGFNVLPYVGKEK